MELESMVAAVRSILTDAANEERAYRLMKAWLVILRDKYHSNPKQFSEEQLEFLKRVRSMMLALQRFMILLEELDDSIDLDEYNQAVQELRLIGEAVGDAAVSRRVRKEIRQLIERRGEVLQYEKSRENARLTDQILKLEETAAPCPWNEHHRLQIRQGKNGYFWGCSEFPS